MGVSLISMAACQPTAESYVEAVRDDSGVVVRPGVVRVTDMRVGDCFEGGQVSADFESFASGFLAVPCVQPHDSEVFAVFDIELESFPDGDAMFEEAAAACVQRFEPFVGRDYQTSSLMLSALYPSSETWAENNDREVVCYLFHVENEKLVGSAQGSGM